MKLDISEERLPWKEPKLSKPADNDLTKQWCVVYGVWDFSKNKLVRRRVVLVGPTVAERLAHADVVFSELKPLAGTAYLGEKPIELRKPKVEKIAPVDQAVVSPSLRVHQAVKLYLEYTKKALAPNSFKSYRSALLALETYLERHRRGSMTLGQFETADAIEFLNELITVVGLSNRTRNNIKGHVGTFFFYFINLDRSKKLKKQGNPFHDNEIGKLPQVQNKHQSYSLTQQSEYREVCLATGNEYLLTFCRWMYYTLMRPHEELRRLRVRDVRTKLIYVTGDTAKTNDGDFVDIPLPLELMIQQQKIREYPGHYYVFTASGEPGPEMVGNKFFYRRHVKVIEKMNLAGSGHDMYSWKHTGAIALWTATKDIELVRSQARHSDIKQTIEYLRDLGIRLADDDKIDKFPVF
ncbi:hypothetical protein [Spirosoma endophyticum]|uniref:hypothetical protein n=1 Tax=Spirosoma endophyticum TaxID=662367 RepID=UPI0015A6258F|nr:hypothetical protein [Spirosoma endophyticum]